MAGECASNALVLSPSERAWLVLLPLHLGMLPLPCLKSMLSCAPAWHPSPFGLISTAGSANIVVGFPFDTVKVSTTHSDAMHYRHCRRTHWLPA